MQNQFGQRIEVGDIVGHVSKTGSYTDRKVGRVVGFGERKDWSGKKVEDTVLVDWLLDGAYGEEARSMTGLSRGVGITRLLKLDPAGIPLPA